METNTVEYWLTEVRKNPHNLELAPQEMKGNKAIVKAAVCRPFIDYINYDEDGWHVKRLFDSLAVFSYASPALQQDEQFIREMVPHCSGFIYRYIHPNLKHSFDLFLFCAEHASLDYLEGLALAYCHKNDLTDLSELFNTYSLMYYLQQVDILGGDHANTPAFLSDRENVLLALQHQPTIFSCLDIGLKNDKNICVQAVQFNHFNFYEVGEAMCDDLDVVLAYLIGELTLNSELTTTEAIWDQVQDWNRISDRLKKHPDLYRGILEKMNWLRPEVCLFKAPEEVKKLLC